MGSYRDDLPLAFAGWRLRIPGNPPGGQYHGYLGASPRGVANPGSYDGSVYRSPGETPPQINAGGPTVRVPHSRRQAGFSVVPGAYKTLGYYPNIPLVDPPNSNLRMMPWGSEPIVAGPFSIRGPVTPSGGATSSVPQPPPPYAPIAKPPISTLPVRPIWNWRQAYSAAGACPGGETQDAAGNCVQNSQYGVVAACQPGQTVDAAGECVTDLRNPYSLYLPAQPSPVMSAPTAATPTAGQPTCAAGTVAMNGNCVASSTAIGTPTGLSWFTDPAQEIISGIPNWGIVAAAAAAFMFMRGRR